MGKAAVIGIDGSDDEDGSCNSALQLEIKIWVNREDIGSVFLVDLITGEKTQLKPVTQGANP